MISRVSPGASRRMMVESTMVGARRSTKQGGACRFGREESNDKLLPELWQEMPPDTGITRACKIRCIHGRVPMHLWGDVGGGIIMACAHTFRNGTFYADCPFCGAESEVKLPIAAYARWQMGEMAQNVWPEMSREDREILISGICKECQKTIFAPPED